MHACRKDTNLQTREVRIIAALGEFRLGEPPVYIKADICPDHLRGCEWWIQKRAMIEPVSTYAYDLFISFAPDDEAWVLG